VPRVQAPAIALPKGGGAIRGIGEKFSSNPVTGTGSMSVPIALSPGRSGFGPQLALSYDSGAGQGTFAMGWQLALPGISRKTDKGLPRYRDDEESDVFLLSGAEDLVPVLDDGGERVVQPTRFARADYSVHLYRPRIEGLFARIERWSETGKPENTFWRTLSRDNVATWYGRDQESRIFDPEDPARIFQWLICQTHDDKGNAAIYRYVADDSHGVDTGAAWETNRRPQARQANRYLKRILYGGATPFLPMLEPELDELPLPTNWMFEAVFDYGDHGREFPTPAPDRTTPANPWPARADAFSNHRAGFEVRTYRLCRRVLMFHHFPSAPEVGVNCLVRSTEFDYALPAAPVDATRSGYTVLRSVTHRSYQRKPGSNTDYERRDLPPVTFTYSQPVVGPTVHTIDSGQLDNLPVGTQGPGYQWIDLDGEGLSGALAEQSGGWYYKPNLGDGHFGAMRVVAAQPAMVMAADSRHQFMDLAGDGEIDVVDFSGPTPGFHQRDRDEGWKRHVPFASLPNIDWQDPNLRFVDLTGDGHADALITEQEVFTWYPSLDERGFAAAERTRQARDEDAGPQLVFADGTQTIFLADMCGDGLTALVRIRNGEVCYWPNLGYGRFGRKVTLGNSPRFDHSDLYDPRRIRLTDIDGSGPIDLIYLGRQGAQLYFNRSGNSLSDALLVDLPLATENLGAVQAADLLGNGTACLVWNSHLPADARHPVRYIDLMGGANETQDDHRKHEKPHLLIKVNNNLGGITEIEYTPSTRFYLQDQQAGTPWVTRLPFPVHCVSKVTVHDQWRGTAFSSTYSYHHGYFDGAEREFRGFGRVEQVDVESYGTSAEHNAASPYVTQDKTLYQPPVKTVTWYHTGVSIDRQRILNHFENEYFPRRFAERLPDPVNAPNSFHERALPEPEIPANLTETEWREALRACKGMVLRQEIYELDVDDIAAIPAQHTPVRIFSAATHNCHIRRLQARGDNRHAVFLVTESEALSYHYELSLPKDSSPLEPDPRITHTLSVRHDEFGNPQQSIAIGYGRWQPGDHGTLPRPDFISQVQGEVHVAYSETRYTRDVLVPDPALGTVKAVRHHRLRLPCEVRSYEITGLAKPANTYFDIDVLRQHALCEDATYPPVVPATLPPQSAIGLTPLQYHEQAKAAGPHRRIVEHARTRYFDDGDDSSGKPKTPTAALPFGQHGPRGLKYEDYKLALTNALLQAVFTERDAAGNVIDKLAWELEPATATVAAITARSLLDTPAVGYIPGTQIDAALTDQYWMRSGIAGFNADAAQHYYLPERYTDPFNNTTELSYDALDLFVESSKDALQNEVRVTRFDFRVLAPREIADINGNHTEAAFDIRGQVVAVATKGKEFNGQWEGDNLSGFSFALANPTPEQVTAFCAATQADRGQARTWLADASVRFVYHFGEANGLWAQRMAGACGIQRERHASVVRLDPEPDPEKSNPIQIALECSDGAGNVLMKKVQAEPEPGQTALRWIINGLTVLNNKGKPVKQYEPSFVGDFGCQLPQAFGVSPTLYYDAVGRLMRTEFADGSLARVEFSPWHVKRFDQNDTVLESRWYADRGSPPASSPRPADPERRAAWLAAQHAGTAALTLLDSLGRDVVAIAHNRAPDSAGVWQDDFPLTYTRLDAEGKPLWIRDARGNLVMQTIHPAKPTRWADTLPDPLRPNELTRETMPAASVPCYDIAGNLLHQHSMDGGDRWMLTDAAGKPMLAWDFNQRTLDDGTTLAERRLFHTRYDSLHRPIAHWLRINDDAPALVEAFEYLDVDDFKDATGAIDQGALNAAQSDNLVGQAVRHYDPSGLGTVERVDFKGAATAVTCTLISDVKAAVIAWNVADRQPLLEAETFRKLTEHDALGRVTRLYNWHRDISFQADGTQQATPGQSNRVAVHVPRYNARGVLDSEWLHVRATKTTDAAGRVSATPDVARSRQAIKAIIYDAKGQKTSLALGNGSVTRYTYDALTFRLTHLYTRRNATFAGDCAGDADAPRPARPCGVQNLHYSHDPVGNITHIQDDAQDTIWFANAQVDASNDYTYDALYRLIEATGRENTAAPAPPPHVEGEWPVGPMPSPNAVSRYTQTYLYDSVGNFTQMHHRAQRPAGQPNGDWIRHYTVAGDSNRLDRTWYGSNVADTVGYRHDPHGSMLNLANTAPGLDMRWDWRDMIRALDLQGGGHAFYNYGIDKQRTRKRLVRNPTVGNGGTVKEDRIYLGGYELYRRYTSDPNEPVEEIESHHLFEGEERVLLVDDVCKTRNPRPDGQVARTQTLWRYQFGNHLQSIAVELDEDGRQISREEFHPYGTTAYRMASSMIEGPAKRYRYTRMEKDEESGLSYHAATYYVMHGGRWASADPSGIRNGIDLFVFAACNPIQNHDRSGLAAVPERPTERPVFNKRIGAEAHRDILPRLAALLTTAMLPSIPFPLRASEEVRTQPGGSKPGPNSAGQAGSVDLIVFEPKFSGNIDGEHTSVLFAHFYELKDLYTGYNDSRLKSDNTKVTWDRQLQNYLRHDAFEERSGEVYEANFGTVLEKYKALISVPMPFDKGNFVRWYWLRLPPGMDGRPIPGLIEYTYLDVPKNKTEQKKAAKSEEEAAADKDLVNQMEVVKSGETLQRWDWIPAAIGEAVEVLETYGSGALYGVNALAAPFVALVPGVVKLDDESRRTGLDAAL